MQRIYQYFIIVLLSVYSLWSPLVVSANNINTHQYFPYTKYTEYQYQGDGEVFESFTVILEFYNHNEQRFQTVEVSPTKTIARIFEINDNGFYEIARYDDYVDVQDLRYHNQMKQNESRLILPHEISEDITYNVASDENSKMKLIDILSNIMIDGITYYDVLVIEEKNEHGLNFLYYYARDFGLIYVEASEDNNDYFPVLVLSRVSGYQN